MQGAPTDRPARGSSVPLTVAVFYVSVYGVVDCGEFELSAIYIGRMETKKSTIGGVYFARAPQLNGMEGGSFIRSMNMAILVGAFSGIGVRSVERHLRFNGRSGGGIAGSSPSS